MADFAAGTKKNISIGPTQLVCVRTGLGESSEDAAEHAKEAINHGSNHLRLRTRNFDNLLANEARSAPSPETTCSGSLSASASAIDMRDQVRKSSRLLKKSAIDAQSSFKCEIAPQLATKCVSLWHYAFCKWVLTTQLKFLQAPIARAT